MYKIDPTSSAHGITRACPSNQILNLLIMLRFFDV